MSDPKYYASVFAKFETEDQRDIWMKLHGVDQSVPFSGPVFSYSPENESVHRDEVDSLNRVKDRIVHRRNEIQEDLEQAQAALIAMSKSIDKDDGDRFLEGYDTYLYWAQKIAPVIDAAQELKRLGCKSVDYQNTTVNAQAYEALSHALAELTE